jgi:hypothetical protein
MKDNKGTTSKSCPLNKANKTMQASDYNVHGELAALCGAELEATKQSGCWWGVVQIYDL